MTHDLYRYFFPGEVPLADVESALLLAIFATESLHGESQTKLDAAHCFDDEQRACVIDASTQVGIDLNRIFVGFLLREFPEDAFTVERIEKTEETEPSAARS